MDIKKYLNIDDINTNNLNDTFLEHSCVDIKNIYISNSFCQLLAKQNVTTIINFINMFKDVDKFEAHNMSAHRLTLGGNIMLVMSWMRVTNQNKNNVHIIVDHLLKLNMDANMLGEVTYPRTDGFITLDFFSKFFNNKYTYYYITNIINNYPVVQYVRKIINNQNILLIDINNNLKFIESILLICKCKQKNLPKFIITHKILYYYLLYKDSEYN